MKSRKHHKPRPGARWRRPFPSFLEGNGLFLLRRKAEPTGGDGDGRMKRHIRLARICGALAALTIALALLRCLNRPALPDSTAYVDALEQELAAMPNTCRGCMLHTLDKDCDIYLLYLRTGTAYNISVYDGQPRQGSYGYNLGNQGSAHACTKYLEEGKAVVTLKGLDELTLEAENLKSLYCDGCIQRLLAAVRGHPTRLLIVDPTQDALHPIAYGRGGTANHRYKIKPDGKALAITVVEK